MPAPRAIIAEPAVYEIAIRDATDAELADISKKTFIGLSKDEMLQVQRHFKAAGREPTDIELEALGQAWSEHCCYKSSRSVLKRHVYGIHEEKIIAREDAGVLPFDKDWAYAVKMESHNHPSAIEPYGGASTGVGGILRDITCMGAQPIALVDPLFFGPPDIAFEKLPKGVKHPRYLFGGVVGGIRDYGNRVGIPTVAGSVYFHEGYLTNCLVNAGCIGILRRKKLVHSWVKAVGDNYVLIGGRTGRDGIHGVTFASADLHEESESESRGAVQLGDPITKEPVIHVCLEATERGLLQGMKDLGGGGLSCVAGEMARDAGLGAAIELDKVLLKEADMRPWEVWVSESQERMMLVVTDRDLPEVLAICEKWDVEASVVGKVIPEKRVRVTWRGAKIFDMDSEFLYEGPVYERPIRAPARPEIESPPKARPDYSSVLLKLLAAPNIASREAVVRMYDHEVRAATTIKPLQGKMGSYTHGDATVLKPLRKSWRGLALTTDVNPAVCKVDPYWGAAGACDEVARNLASVGARLDSLIDCLNFGNPELPERMWEINESAKGLGDFARSFGVPLASGNVSLYNEGPLGPIPPTPSMLGAGIVRDIRKCVTSDLKKSGSPLFLVGVTKNEMGGSEYHRLAGGASSTAPRVDFDLSRRASEAVVTAIEKRLVRAAHDVSLGGIAVTLAEMGFGGDLGAKVALDGDLSPDVALFSESNTRWVLEARSLKDLETHFKKAKVPVSRIGATGGKTLQFKVAGKKRASVSLADARSKWEKGLVKAVGW
ncbi:MAG: phosphoribosylformylglycinamidine synthase subunit PurL [Euryarchaeota archaeon]|nr:phosphoribosylformylglycinamidine synthase subunit PurL [Euryarchaeota archaeon]